MDSLEQESSDESTRGSTTKDEPKKFLFHVEIYADKLEEELDPNELVLLAEPTTYHVVATETMW